MLALASDSERAREEAADAQAGVIWDKNIMPLSDSFLVIIFLSPVLLKWQNYHSIIYRQYSIHLHSIYSLSKALPFIIIDRPLTSSAYGYEPPIVFKEVYDELTRCAIA